MGRRAGPPVLYQRGGVWWCRFTAHGKRHEVSTGEGDLGAAEKAAAKIHAEAVLDAPAVARKPTRTRPGSLDDLSLRYLAWARTQGRDERYIREQEIHFDAHFLSRWNSLGRITSAAIARYQVERTSGARPVTTVTLYKELVTLSRFLKWAKREGLIEAIPEFERPTQTSTYQVPNVTPAQVQEFLAALPTRATHPKHFPVQEYARFLWSVALRFTEGTSIRWSDVDLPAGRLTVRKEIDKAGKTWVLPLSVEALELLREEVKRPHHAGDRLFPFKSVRDSFDVAIDKLNENREGEQFPRITPHHLRHFRISEWANSTRRLAAVQFMARHLSIATTALYVRSRTEAAEEMLREIEEGKAGSETEPPNNSATGRKKKKPKK